MVNKMISIPHELNEKLKSETNASGLIAKLLIEHYKFSSENVKDIEAQQEELKSKEMKLLERLEEDFNKLENKKILIKKQTEAIENLEEKNQKKKLEMVENIRKSYLELTEKDMSDETLEEYIKKLRMGEVKSIFQFIEEENAK